MREAHDSMPVKRTITGKRKRSFPAKMSSAKLEAQVKRLMRLRQEKKYAESTVEGNIGQVDASLSGALVAPLGPAIIQGDGEGQRIGNSITATGLVWKQQLSKQINGIGPRRVRTHIVRVLGDNPTTTSVLEGILDVNPLSGVRDYFSSLNYTMMADKRMTILGTKETKLTSNFNDTMNSAYERSTGEMTIPIKFEEQTLRFERDSDLSFSNVHYFVISLCDAGNKNATASSLPVVVSIQDSGVISKGYMRLWYTDS
uniref:Uncharacterized protein n=1 Tax=uncultured prokaryote TaxID=198431 RepID=A0A0H5Q753_9ZZZZ|nr:hypothetical protein [uncultured prokaryote]